MYFHAEKARTPKVTPKKLAEEIFGPLHGASDAVFLDGQRKTVLAAKNLPFAAPVCDELRRADALAPLFAAGKSLLFDFAEEPLCQNEAGLLPLTPAQQAAAQQAFRRVTSAPGTLNENGEQVLDLRCPPVGPHYGINLLLGWRAGYTAPLFTTPKAAVDAFGRGSFRAGGPKQVLASRCVLQPEENGEPVNRQFYLYEDGKKIFYSLDVRDCKRAVCTHSQNRTVIEYLTGDDLRITRTIFLPQQQDNLPDALEVQKITVENLGQKPRTLKIVLTGEFGIAGPETVANDVIYANVVHQSEVLYDAQNRPVCLTLDHKPADQKGEKRFALMLCKGQTMDNFCCNLSEFVGGGTLADPELGNALPNRPHRKLAPFFAMDKEFTAAPGETVEVDEFVGMMDRDHDASADFDAAIHALLQTYRCSGAVDAALQKVTDFQAKYTSYLTPDSGDEKFDAYVGKNMPFQVLYQTFVSRAFAWTQKSYRETGFREIQDIFASMYYLNAAGQSTLVKQLISCWAVNVFRMGYAYHDFTWKGKEPGDCSDDQLWLAQAVYRYCTLTGDYDFLREELPIAGENAKRPLAETLMAILEYSGRISVGKHGMPLLDKADWNDTLRLDKTVRKGPEKEALYRRQLAESGRPWGTPLQNTDSESTMNSCLLKIAADETAELLEHLDETAYADWIAKAHCIAGEQLAAMQQYAWKGNFFARALINDGRGYEYLGAEGDGLSADPALNGSYFLNSFGWSILAGVATEDQIKTMLDVVEANLKTNAGLRLCTLVAYEKLGVNTATGLYYPGDRENGGVFKHAAMMSTAAMFKAAREVESAELADRLRSLGWWMIGKTLPYATMRDPFTTKGNPRFCTQYNNTETGENIGPMLSGTASWLTLALLEALGVEDTADGFTAAPVLPPHTEHYAYTLCKNSTPLRVEIDGSRAFRAGADSSFKLDGVSAALPLSLPADGKPHALTIVL